MVSWHGLAEHAAHCVSTNRSTTFATPSFAAFGNPAFAPPSRHADCHGAAHRIATYWRHDEHPSPCHGARESCTADHSRRPRAGSLGSGQRCGGERRRIEADDRQGLATVGCRRVRACRKEASEGWSPVGSHSFCAEVSQRARLGTRQCHIRPGRVPVARLHGSSAALRSPRLVPNFHPLRRRRGGLVHRDGAATVRWPAHSGKSR